MKKKKWAFMSNGLLTLSALLLALLFSKSGISQVPNVLEVRITDISYLPDITGEGEERRVTFSNPGLATLLSGYTVTNFTRAYPSADEHSENPLEEGLSRVYTIEITGNEVALYQHLVENGSTYFDRIEYVPEILPLYTPDDFTLLEDAAGMGLDLIKIRDAWDITTGSSGVKIAIVESSTGSNGFDTSHEDFVNTDGTSQIDYVESGININPASTSFHGTGVAGVAGAAVDNNKGMTGVGYNCKLMLYIGGYNDILQASIDGADIINCSWKTSSCNYNANHAEIIALATENGALVVAGAGNGNQGPHCDDGPQVGFIDDGEYPNGYVYPGSYEKVLCVSSVSLEDDYEQGENAHTYNDKVDLTAPGYHISSLAPQGGYDSDGLWGTSFASPMVAGVAGLVLSVESCLKPSSIKDILMSTTDDISANENNAAYTGYCGTGRLNAEAAVLAAQTYMSPTLDLYIKDRSEDLGESGGYHWEADRDNSPDIWVRNEPDGFENTEHEEPAYTGAGPVYVYVRVRNKSCIASAGTEELALYWTKASTWASWPQNWDGSSPTTGDVIDVVTIPVIEGGDEVILEFEWDILDPAEFDTWTSCLLARIENSVVDPIAIYPDKLNDDVYYNNNIAWKNLTVIDMSPGIVNPTGIQDIGFSLQYIPGRTIYIGNPTGVGQTYDFSLTADIFEEYGLTDVAEVKVLFESDGWEQLSPYFERKEEDGIYITGEREITIKNNEVTISGITIPANTRYPIHIGANFLTEKDRLVERKDFSFHIRQYLNSTGEILGGEHFRFVREDRYLFTADGGDDISVHKRDRTTVVGELIAEDAEYKWYNAAGDELSTDNRLTFVPASSMILTYEVTSKLDGYKDYDEVEITVMDYWINSVSPNPASDNITVSYNADGATNTQISITNILTNESTTYTAVSAADGSLVISVDRLAAGSYDVTLHCDGAAQDTKRVVVR